MTHESARPLFVNSLPKSGTYLLAAILEELGLEFTQQHVSRGFFDDYRNAAREEARANPKHFRVKQPVAQTIAAIGAGQFAVGHLKYDSEIIKAMRGCPMLFLHRDLRPRLVSHCRWLVATGRDASAWTTADNPRAQLLAYLQKRGPGAIAQAKAIMGWRSHAGHVVRFEELRDAGAIERMAAWLGVPFRPEAIEAALSRPTLTRMPAIDWREYWSDEAEAIVQGLWPEC